MSPSTTPRLMHRPWTHLAHLVSLSVYVCVFWPSGVWPDPPSHLPGRAAGRRRESGGQSEIPGIPATPPPFFLSPLWRPHGAHQGKREEEAKKTHWKLQPCIQIVFTYLHKKKKNQRGLTPDLETYMELRRSVHVRFVYLLIKSVHRKWGLPSKVNPVNFVLELQYVRFSNLPKQGPSKPMGAAYHC